MMIPPSYFFRTNYAEAWENDTEAVEPTPAPWRGLLTKILALRIKPRPQLTPCTYDAASNTHAL